MENMPLFFYFCLCVFLFNPCIGSGQIDDKLTDRFSNSGRDENEAYAMAITMDQYAVYFPKGGEVTLDVSTSSGNMTVLWLDLINSIWLDSDMVENRESITLLAPDTGPWAVLVRRNH